MAHHNAVGGGGGAKDLRYAAASENAFTAFTRQAVEVGVAGRDVTEELGNADDGPLEIVVLEADGPQHGAVRGAAGAFGGETAGGVALGRHGGFPQIIVAVPSL
jgi:hypothetical protein